MGIADLLRGARSVSDQHAADRDAATPVWPEAIVLAARIVGMKPSEIVAVESCKFGPVIVTATGSLVSLGPAGDANGDHAGRVCWWTPPMHRGQPSLGALPLAAGKRAKSAKVVAAEAASDAAAVARRVATDHVHAALARELDAVTERLKSRRVDVPEYEIVRERAWAEELGRRLEARRAEVTASPAAARRWTEADARELQLDGLVAKDETAQRYAAERAAALERVTRHHAGSGSAIQEREYAETLRLQLRRRRAELADELPAPGPKPRDVTRCVATIIRSRAILDAPTERERVEGIERATRMAPEVALYPVGMARADLAGALKYLADNGLDEDGQPFAEVASDA